MLEGGVMSIARVVLNHQHYCRKPMAMLVIVCLLAHLIVPLRGNASEQMRDLVGQALGPQAVMMEFFSLSALPLKLIGTLMNETGTGFPARPPKNHRSGTESTDSSDVSIDTRDYRAGCYRTSAGPQARLNIHDCSPGGASRGERNGRPAHAPVFPPGVLSLILLVLFILLPRSGIDGDAARIFSCITQTRIAGAFRVFYCSGATA